MSGISEARGQRIGDGDTGRAARPAVDDRQREVDCAADIRIRIVDRLDETQIRRLRRDGDGRLVVLVGGARTTVVVWRGIRVWQGRGAIDGITNQLVGLYDFGIIGLGAGAGDRGSNGLGHKAAAGYRANAPDSRAAVIGARTTLAGEGQSGRQGIARPDVVGGIGAVIHQGQGVGNAAAHRRVRAIHGLRQAEIGLRRSFGDGQAGIVILMHRIPALTTTAVIVLGRISVRLVLGSYLGVVQQRQGSDQIPIDLGDDVPIGGLALVHGTNGPHSRA